MLICVNDLFFVEITTKQKNQSFMSEECVNEQKQKNIFSLTLEQKKTKSTLTVIFLKTN